MMTKTTNGTNQVISDGHQQLIKYLNFHYARDNRHTPAIDSFQDVTSLLHLSSNDGELSDFCTSQRDNDP